MDSLENSKGKELPIESKAGIEIELFLRQTEEKIKEYIKKALEKRKPLSVSGAIYYVAKEIAREEIERLYPQNQQKKEKDTQNNQKNKNKKVIFIDSSTRNNTDISTIALSDLLYRLGNEYKSITTHAVASGGEEKGGKPKVLDEIREKARHVVRMFQDIANANPRANKTVLLKVTDGSERVKQSLEDSLKVIGKHVGEYYQQESLSKRLISFLQEDYEKNHRIFNDRVISIVEGSNPDIRIGYSELCDDEIEKDESVDSVRISFSVRNKDVREIINARFTGSLRESKEKLIQLLANEFMRYKVYPKYVSLYSKKTGQDIQLTEDGFTELLQERIQDGYTLEAFWSCYPYALQREYAPHINRQGDIVVSYYLYPRLQRRTGSLRENIRTLIDQFEKANRELNGYKPLKDFVSKCRWHLKGDATSNLYRAVKLIGNLYIYLALIQGKNNEILENFTDFAEMYLSTFKSPSTALGWYLGLPFFNGMMKEKDFKSKKKEITAVKWFLSSLFKNALMDDDQFRSDKSLVEQALQDTADRLTGGDFIHKFNSVNELDEKIYKTCISETLKNINGKWETENDIVSLVQQNRVITAGFYRNDGDNGGLHVRVHANLTKTVDSDGAGKHEDRVVAVRAYDSQVLFRLPAKFSNDNKSKKRKVNLDGSFCLLDSSIRVHLNQQELKTFSMDTERKAYYTLTLLFYLLLYSLYLASKKQPTTIFSVYNKRDEDASDISLDYVISKDLVLGLEALMGERVNESGIEVTNLLSVNRYAVPHLLTKSILQKVDIEFEKIKQRVWVMFICKGSYTVSYGEVNVHRYGAFIVGLDPQRGYIPTRYLEFETADELVERLKPLGVSPSDYIIVRSFGYISEFYSVVDKLSVHFPNVLLTKTSVKMNSDSLSEKSIIREKFRGKDIWHFVNPFTRHKDVKIWKTLSLYRYVDANDPNIKDVFLVIMSYLNSKKLSSEDEDAVGKVSLFNSLETNTIKNRNLFAFKARVGKSPLTVTIPLAVLIAKLRYITGGVQDV